MDINYNFIKHWKELGDEQKSDPINQFFYYFVAFNCLYDNVFTESHPNPDNQNHITDRHKLSEFRSSYAYKICKENGFDPCQDLSKIPELAKGVIDSRSDPKYRSHNKIFSYKPIWEQEKKLFENVYQVRCNLFHGKKYVIAQESRNYKLIRECVYVLDSLLTAFLKTISQAY